MGRTSDSFYRSEGGRDSSGDLHQSILPSTPSTRHISLYRARPPLNTPSSWRRTTRTCLRRPDFYHSGPMSYAGQAFDIYSYRRPIRQSKSGVLPRLTQDSRKVRAGPKEEDFKYKSSKEFQKARVGRLFKNRLWTLNTCLQHLLVRYLF